MIPDQSNNKRFMSIEDKVNVMEDKINAMQFNNKQQSFKAIEDRLYEQLSKKIDEAKIINNNNNSKVVERQKVIESISTNGTGNNMKKVEHALNDWL